MKTVWAPIERLGDRMLFLGQWPERFDGVARPPFFVGHVFGQKTLFHGGVRTIDLFANLHIELGHQVQQLSMTEVCELYRIIYQNSPLLTLGPKSSATEWEKRVLSKPHA